MVQYAGFSLHAGLGVEAEQRDKLERLVRYVSRPPAGRGPGARRLQRVFGIEIEQCLRCGGRLKVIASIEEPELIERILAHRREPGEEDAPVAPLGARAPPQASLF
ncbi:MAG: hypothetical protein ACRETI_01330 [Steroidobacteraceae bacterium]